MRGIFGAVLAALFMAGCASKSADIAPAYVSPLMYQSFTCPQLTAEAQRVSAAAAAAAGQQDSQATKDAVATTVSVIVFWPALFLVGGDVRQVAGSRSAPCAECSFLVPA